MYIYVIPLHVKYIIISLLLFSHLVEFSTPIYPIRLVTDKDNSTHNSSLYYGRVEIKNGTASDLPWGTVCDEGWGIEDADIACKQLGIVKIIYDKYKYKLNITYYN